MRLADKLCVVMQHEYFLLLCVCPLFYPFHVSVFISVED